MIGHGDGWAYIIQEGTCGHIKVGKANDPESRIATLQTGNPRPLVTLAVIPGGRTMEAAIHARWASFRGLGEWFFPTSTVMAQVAELAALYGDNSLTRLADRWPEHKMIADAMVAANRIAASLPTCEIIQKSRGVFMCGRASRAAAVALGLPRNVFRVMSQAGVIIPAAGGNLTHTVRGWGGHKRQKRSYLMSKAWEAAQ